MTHAELLAYFGNSPTMVSKTFGISKCAPFYWKVRGVPFDRQIFAEAMTGGVLKADWSCIDPVLVKLWDCAKGQYELNNLIREQGVGEDMCRKRHKPREGKGKDG